MRYKILLYQQKTDLAQSRRGALLLGNNGVERALLLSVCMVVVVAELLNSAIEAVVDRIGPEHHSLAGAAKDMGSAAVFVSLVMVVMVWGVLLYERFC